MSLWLNQDRMMVHHGEHRHSRTGAEVDLHSLSGRDGVSAL